MLENLDKIPWETLTHAYGAAADVPGQLRGLLSPSAKIREESYGELCSNIFHQGSRYEASSYAVPFLWEMFKSPLTPERIKVLKLINYLAIGYDEMLYPEGVNTVKLNKLREGYNKAEIFRGNDIGNLRYLIDDDCYTIYQMVNDLIPELLQYLDEEDEDIQLFVIYILTWFPDHASSSIPAILEKLTNSKKEILIGNGLLCIGLLNKNAIAPLSLDAIKTYLTQESPFIQISAGIALAKIPLEEELLPVLLKGATMDRKQFKNTRCYYCFGDIVAYSCSVLSFFGENHRREIVDALCLFLESDDFEKKLNVTTAIVQFMHARHHKKINELPSKELDGLDINMLTAIEKHGAWEKDGKPFVKYQRLMERSGIPYSVEKLRRFLDVRNRTFRP